MDSSRSLDSAVKFKGVLVRVSIAVKDTMTRATLIKNTFHWGGSLRVSEVVHCHHNRVHGSMQVDTGPHLDQKETGSWAAS